MSPSPQREARNLRGWTVLVDVDGTPRRVTVVTHTRGDRWLVDGRSLPRRFERFLGCRRTVVSEDQMTLIEPPEQS